MGSAANIPGPNSTNPSSSKSTSASTSTSTSAPASVPTDVPGPISTSTSASAVDPIPTPGPEAETETESKEGPEVKIQDVLVPWVLKGKTGEEDVVHHRYYHLFVQGELREMVLEAAREEGYRTPTALTSGDKEATPEGATPEGEGPWLRVKGEGWEADNWWIEAEVGKGPYRLDTAATRTAVSEP